MRSLSFEAAIRGVRPRPPRWDVAFGRNAPLEVDLGCGRGRYALERAANFPGIDVVALESRRKWVHLIRQRAAKAGLKNIRAIQCDVARDLDMLFEPKSVRGFTIHHPDPWWKKRHRKRRLVRPELASRLVELLEPEGFIYFQTDVPDLAGEAKEIFGSLPELEQTDAIELRAKVLGGIKSHREAKCLELGIPVSRLAWLKLRTES